MYFLGFIENANQISQKREFEIRCNMLFFEWSGNFYVNKRKRKKINKRKSMGQPRHLDPRVVQHAG